MKRLRRFSLAVVAIVQVSLLVLAEGRAYPANKMLQQEITELQQAITELDQRVTALEQNVPSDAGGPRIAAVVVIPGGGGDMTIRLGLVGQVNQGTVVPMAFSVTALTPPDGGWLQIPILSAVVGGGGSYIEISAASLPPSGDLVRVMARGTGSEPILGTNSVPMAGAVGGPAGTANNGNDFVTMFVME